MKHISTIIGAAGLFACLFGTACGGGSQSSLSSTTSDATPKAVMTGSHVLGSADAKVTLIEFADIQCPYCKAFFTDTEAQIMDSYVNTGKVKIAFRHFPLSMHQNAQIAAEATECAAKVGGSDAFWRYHDVVFANSHGDGTGLDAISLKHYAVDLQLDIADFNACLDNHQTAAIVSKDFADGVAAGVQATPSFFINGKPFVGAQPFSAFKAAIDAEL